MNEEMKKAFDDALMACEKGPGMMQLIQHMENNGFYSAPCSGGHHLSKEGGLLEHSLNVMRTAIQIGTRLLPGEEFDKIKKSLVFCALLHDVGKMGQFGKPNYIPNILKSGEVSKTKPYVTNPDLIYEEHEIRSIVIISEYIRMTEEEQNAILHHNGLWGKLDSSYSSSFDKHTLSLLIHFADLWCSRYVEGGSDE